MMVTDQGRLIRVPVGDVRVAGRNTQGVTLFKVGDNEKIVSVERVEETVSDEDDAEDADLSEVQEVETPEVSPETLSDNPSEE